MHGKKLSPIHRQGDVIKPLFNCIINTQLETAS